MIVLGVLSALLLVGAVIGFAYIGPTQNDPAFTAQSGVPQQPGLPQQPGFPQQPGSPGQPSFQQAVPASANAPQINLQFSGACAPRFDLGRNMVMGSSGTITVNSVSNEIHGSLTIKLPGPGVHRINTAQMTQGVIVQLMAVDTMWMGMAMNAGDVLGSGAQDPISGVIHARQFDASTSQMDLTFDNVILQNAENGGLCSVNGTVRTSGNVTGY